MPLQDDDLDLAETSASPNRVATLSRLDVGQTHTESRRLPLRRIKDGTIAEAANGIRNMLSPAVARAKAATGNEYIKETTSSLVGREAVLVSVAVTRVE